MKRLWIIAALTALAALAFAGPVAAAAASSSPPAPRRAAVSPRHSAARASATATHAVRVRHAKRHGRGYRRREGSQRLIARTTTTGGFPPLPVRRNTASHHHAALGPAPHQLRQLARSKDGAAADSPAAVASISAMSRVGTTPLVPPISSDDRMKLSRGPPRAGPVALHSSRISRSPFRHFPHPSAFTPDNNRVGPTLPLAAHAVGACWVLLFPVGLSRERLDCRPHACRREGAAACSDSPSTGDPS